MLQVLEAAYRPGPSLEAWTSGVLEAARPCAETELGLTLSTWRWSDGDLRFLSRVHTGEMPASLIEHFYTHETRLEQNELRRLYAPRWHPPLCSIRDIVGSAMFDHSSSFETFRKQGARDLTAITGVDASGVGYALSWASVRPIEISDRDRSRWTNLRAHLLAGLRLHAFATDHRDEAVIAEDGRVVHAEGPAKPKSARERLRDAAIQLDRVRSASTQLDPDEKVTLWQGLVDGRWSLIDHFDSDGRRYVVARRNDPSLTRPRRLSSRERAVLAYAALGRSNKEIAYELGLSKSSVGSYLRAAMGKLGLRHRADAAHLFAMGPAQPTA
ncbi:MAG: LuxR C-terminal-related transcriptional regulator [Sandaracinaceae bacterium]